MLGCRPDDLSCLVHGELVFWTDRGVPHATVRGPETRATTPEVIGDSESFGIVFSHGTSMPQISTASLVDTAWESPSASGRTFALGRTGWEVPRIDDAELLVAGLAREGLLVRDPLVADAVWGEGLEIGVRSVQRRVAAATGLTQGTIRQIERARLAALLLGEGVSSLDVVHGCGYYDQPHLSRSLQRFIGRTATQLRRPDQTVEPLSLLYKPDCPDDFYPLPVAVSTPRANGRT